MLRPTTIIRPASAAALILAEACGGTAAVAHVPTVARTQTPAPALTQAPTLTLAATPTESVPPPEPEPPPPPPPKMVLHLGDSMAGGYGGLTTARADKVPAPG